MSKLQQDWHQTTVAKVEQAQRDLRYPELIALAEALELDLVDLLALRPSDEVSAAADEVHRLDQDRRATQTRLDFIEDDLQSLQLQKEELSGRLTELTEALGKARRVLADARRKQQ